MPTIQDPKMNQHEEDYGILYDNIFGFCLYRKNKSNLGDSLRWLCTGTEVTAVGGYKSLPEREIKTWCGIKILLEALNVEIVQDQAHPVYYAVNEFTKGIFESKNESQIKSKLKELKVPNELAERFSSEYK